MPITHRGNRRILSINDQFSKFTQLYAVPDLTAATSAKCYCVKSVQIRSYFWSLFSRIWNEYGEIRSISPYSLRMLGNMDQKQLRIWTLFTLCVFGYFLKFGIAKKLYSVRDPAFESELFQLLMKMFGVKNQDYRL